MSLKPKLIIAAFAATLVLLFVIRQGRVSTPTEPYPVEEKSPVTDDMVKAVTAARNAQPSVVAAPQRVFGADGIARGNAPVEYQRQWTNEAFQAWVRNYMFGAVSSIVSNVPIYGLKSLSTNGLNIRGQIHNGDAEFTLETPDFIRFAFDSGAIRHIESAIETGSGSYDPRLSVQQRGAAVSAYDWAPDKVWSDSEVLAQFKLVASQFGITESDLNRTSKPDHLTASKKKSMQPKGGPPIPQQQTGGGDAMIEVRLPSANNNTDTMFMVQFKPERMPDGTYRLSVIQLINHNWNTADQNISVEAKRFF